MNEDAFKEKLNPEQYRVMRHRDTERPYSGKFWDNDEGGVYSCAYCGSALFSSLAQIDAGNGWPSFSAPLDSDQIRLTDSAKGIAEVSCVTCGGHLGYLSGPRDAKDTHYILNSASLDFAEFPELPEKEDGDEKKEKEQLKKSASALKSQLQTVLAVLAAVLASAGAGYAAGTAVCGTGTPVVVSPSPSATPVPSPTRTLAPATPSPTPTPIPPSVVPSPSIAPPASGSADGGLPPTP